MSHYKIIHIPLTFAKYPVHISASESNFKLIKYSVIVPTLNRPDLLKRCLCYLSRLAFDPDIYEVLVIDNGSCDKTKRTTAEFTSKIRNLRYIHCEKIGLLAARHKGLEEARGEVLCFIDDDSFVTRHWLEGLNDTFSDESVVLATGPCIPLFESEPPDWLKEFWNEVKWGRCLGTLSLLDFGFKASKISPHFVYGCNFNIRRGALTALGGFHPDGVPNNSLQFRGDGECAITNKLIFSGQNALYCPLAKIHHFVSTERMTRDYFCYRAYIQGISDSFLRLRREHGLEPSPSILNGGMAKPSKWKDSKLLAKLVEAISSYRKPIRWIRYRTELLRRGKRSADYSEYLRIRYLAGKRRQEGFLFHQREVRRNSKVREWALRKNYFGESAKMPE